MRKRLQNVSVLQAGIVLAALYGLLSLIFVPFLMLGIIAGLLAPSGQAQVVSTVFMLILCVFIPLIYAILGFIGGVIGAFVYNLIAKFTGGLEFTLVDAPAQ